MKALRWGLVGASTIAREHMIGATRANGGDGSLIATDRMRRQPRGERVPRSAKGVETLKLARENLHARSIHLFQDAIAGKRSPSATRRDGVRSLAVALAAAEAARTGRETSIESQG